jgi:hypothetical protein
MPMPQTANSNVATISTNTNSLLSKYSRYVAGGTSEVANNMIEWWERSIFPRDPSDIVYTVQNFYAGRIDYIASVFYSEPRYGWVIAQYNNIIDPFAEIFPGRILLIPTLARLPLILGTKQGGVASTAEPVSLISPIII